MCEPPEPEDGDRMVFFPFCVRLLKLKWAKVSCWTDLDWESYISTCLLGSVSWDLYSVGTIIVSYTTDSTMDLSIHRIVRLLIFQSHGHGHRFCHKPCQIKDQWVKQTRLTYYRCYLMILNFLLKLRKRVLLYKLRHLLICSWKVDILDISTFNWTWMIFN